MTSDYIYWYLLRLTICHTILLICLWPVVKCPDLPHLLWSINMTFNAVDSWQLADYATCWLGCRRDGYIDPSEQWHMHSLAINGRVLAIALRLISTLCHPQFFFELVSTDPRNRSTDFLSGCRCSRCLMFDVQIGRSLAMVTGQVVTLIQLSW